MCGRFGFDMPKPVLEEQFGLKLEADVPPSWNIAPGQPILAAALFEGRRELLGFHWGLVAPWVRQAGRGHANARSESVYEKPSFKDPIRYRRCLVPASFFYEWKGEGKARQPYAIMLPNRAPFAMAGIYSEHERFGPSLAILTCAPNETMQPIHDRMPVILTPDTYETWFDPYAHKGDIGPLLAPYAGDMTAHPVSSRVNSPANNDRKLLEPVELRSSSDSGPGSGPRQGTLPF